MLVPGSARLNRRRRTSWCKQSKDNRYHKQRQHVAPNLLTLVSPMVMPSLSNSPWMRGAPHSGFSRLIVRIKPRTSRDTAGLPVVPCRTFQVQNRRKPLRCQAMTVSGLTMTSADRQSAQAPDNHAQNKRSATVNFGRFLAERRSTPIWWRNARISTWRAARERKTENRVVRNGDKALHIGLRVTPGLLGNPMISESLRFPGMTGRISNFSYQKC